MGGSRDHCHVKQSEIRVLEGKTVRSLSVPPVVVLVGPTAVGKSALALALARYFPLDIVTADSRQVYRYMDIGTAKPSPEERAQAPHFMIDLVEPSDTYSAQRYTEEARRVLAGSAARKRAVLVTGGTGFYLRALLDAPSFPPVPPNPDLRARLRERAALNGAEALHADLKVLDPVSAERIHPRNLPRIIRALEIVEALGGPVPPSDFIETIPGLYLGLTVARQELREIADRRVDRQIEQGLLEETDGLLAMGYSPDTPSLQGFGYREMVAHLQGRMTLAEATRAYKAATHRYIRRQMTWFRSDPRIEWLEAGPDTEGRAVERIRGWLSTVSTRSG